MGWLLVYGDCGGALTYLPMSAGMRRLQHIGNPRMPQVGELTIFCGAMVDRRSGSCVQRASSEVFMGDVGCWRWWAIGTVAVMIKQNLLPFIGGVFVIEAISVILQVGRTSSVRKGFSRWRQSIITSS